MRRHSAGTIFWGITLVGIGGLLLARNLGYAIPVWGALARYWPLLLIGWGTLKLVDYFRFRNKGDNRPLFSGGEIALLILVIFTGSAITAAANISPEFGRLFDLAEDFDLWDITGNNYAFTDHQEADVPAGSTIEIINRFGSVDVRASDVERVVLDVEKAIRASSKEEADRYAPDFTFAIENNGSSFRIVSSKDKDFASQEGRGGFERQRFKSNLVVQVPRRSTVKVDNRNGSVELRDLTGDQTITNRFASVTVSGVTGSLQIENRNGAVEVENVTSAVTIRNSFADTTAKKIGGALQIENRNGSVEVEDASDAVKITNSFANTRARNVGGALEIENRNGSVEVRSVKGNTTVSNAFASIDVREVQGELNISGRNNSVEVEQVDGPLSVETSFQTVRISDPRNVVDVKNRNGSVEIAFAQAPQKDISVSGEFTEVQMELPPSSAFSIDGQTRFADIQSEFPELQISKSGREQSVNGRVGQGGPSIRIDTRNGNIRLDKR